MNTITIRHAGPADLRAINRIIESAVMNWPMKERVKRLSVTSFQYDEIDLQHYQVLVAEFSGEVVGVAAWEPGQLHGLFVLPVLQRQGIGKKLMDAAFTAAREQDVPGLVIKSRRISRSYFEHVGLEPIAVNDGEYPWQYWKQLA